MSNKAQDDAAQIEVGVRVGNHMLLAVIRGTGSRTDAGGIERQERAELEIGRSVGTILDER